MPYVKSTAVFSCPSNQYAGKAYTYAYNADVSKQPTCGLGRGLNYIPLVSQTPIFFDDFSSNNYGFQAHIVRVLEFGGFPFEQASGLQAGGCIVSPCYSNEGDIP